MAKFTYHRPYYPYVNRYGNQQLQGPNISGAMDIGTKFGEQVAKAIQANKQNQIANQLAAQYGLYAPRAQWVGGTPPAAGVNTQGTSLADAGGVEGLKLRMALQQRQQQQQAAQTKANLQATLAAQQAGKGKSVWTGRTNTPSATTTPSGKTGAYKAGAYDYENGTLNGVKTPDSMTMLQTDIDGATGKKGTAAALLAAVPSMKVVNGKLTIPAPLGADGKPDPNYKPSYRINDDGSFSVLDRNGNPSSTIQKEDMPTVLNRFNALRVRNGQDPLPNPYLAGTEKTSSLPPGSKENPFALDPNKPNTTFRALPNGTYFKNPRTNNIELKNPPGQQQNTVTGQPNVPANQFTPPSEGGTSTDVTAPPRDTGGVNIPMRPTADADQGGGDNAVAQNQQAPNQANLGMPGGFPGNGGGAIAQIDPNTFAPRTQQSPAQVADAVLPNTGVVPTVSDDDRDLLNRMIAGQSLLNAQESV